MVHPSAETLIDAKVEPSPADVPAPARIELDEVADLGRAEVNLSTEDSELASLDASLAESLGDDGDWSEPEVHSVPLASSHADNSRPELEGSAIQTLRVGNWVDFRQEDGRMLRCRLAAVINGIGKYIFVNRSGIKVAELNRDELQLALTEQKVVLIDDDRLFDRALESVISNLRDMKDKPL